MNASKPPSDYEILWYTLDGIEDRLTTHGDAYLTLRGVAWTTNQVADILVVLITVLIDRSVEVTAVDSESYYITFINPGDTRHG